MRKNLIFSIKELQKYIECEFDIEVFAREEGGIKVQYIIKTGKVILCAVVGAWLNNFFRPKIHQTEEIKNKIEIIEKIKQGNFNQEEFDYIANGDKKLKKLKSNF
jgi:hypothetical protein